MSAPQSREEFRSPAPIAAAKIALRRAELLDDLARDASYGPFAPTPESLRQWTAPEWFRDAKFGIFIHWLASSVAGAGSDWYPRHMYIAEHSDFDYHRSRFGDQSSFGYKDLLSGLTGEAFDADEWVAAVRDSGAQYVVPVAEHHDGFSLYDNSLTRWKSTEIGPHRDIISELVVSARKAGLRVGVSSHRAENWWFFGGGRRFPSDVNDDQWRDLYGPAQPWSSESRPDEAWIDDWSARTEELLEKFDPDLIYFDFWVEEPEFRQRLREIAAAHYNRTSTRGEPGVFCYKWEAMDPGTALRDIERGSVRVIQSEPYQNDTSVSRICWSYLEDNDFKSVDELIVDLVDTVSKNGNLLLNIGPRPDGTIDPREVEILRGIGAWLQVHGEAIYGTRPWIVPGEGPTHLASGSFADVSTAHWTADDIRFTSREDVVYAIWLGVPSDRILIRSLGTDVQLVDATIDGVSIVGFDQPVVWNRRRDGLEIRLPRESAARLGVARIELRPIPAPVRYEPPMLR